MTSTEYLKRVVGLVLLNDLVLTADGASLIVPVEFLDEAHYKLFDDNGKILDEAYADGLVKIEKPPLYLIDFEEYLSKPERRVDAPECYFIQSVRWASFLGEEAPPAIKALKAAIRLFSLFEIFSDHTIPFNNDKELVFLVGKRLVVNSLYGSTDLDLIIDLDWFEKEVFYTDVHKANKIEMFRSILGEMYKDEKTVSFSDVLRDFNILVIKLQRSYDLFVSEFSYDKIKSQIEKDKLDFTSRLNRVLSDIQNQLLAVPVAMFLVGSQLVQPERPVLTLNNSAIWLGSVIFVLFLEFLLRNQRSTLQAIGNEIRLQEKMFEKHQKEIFPLF
ncbi:hypothetical protein [Salinicola halimionae]|uniref:hypothetical protein n=1 Tax=Salinicola halimionae TaxID=1949081 RepID=UPI000DA1B08D|nr:hypothetical protein [Salinicola halimionae]